MLHVLIFYNYFILIRRVSRVKSQLETNEEDKME